MLVRGFPGLGVLTVFKARGTSWRTRARHGHAVRSGHGPGLCRKRRAVPPFHAHCGHVRPSENDDRLFRTVLEMQESRPVSEVKASRILDTL